MGLDRTIRFPTADTPEWEAIRANLLRVGESGQLRMIDGMPAFPDETPADEWKELRVGMAAGMVTIRRGSGFFSCVVWGNADPALNAAWARVIWACAAAGGGAIETSTGSLSAEEFARGAGLAPE
jgi:hypothetical protein